MATSTRTTICSPSEVLTYLGKGSTVSDADLGLLNMLMTLTDNTIKTFLGYGVVQTTYTHILPDVDMFIVNQNDIGLPVDVVNNQITYTFPGPPVILQVPEIPLRDITGLWMDYAALGGQGPSDFAAATLLTQGTNYYVDYDEVDTIPGGTAGISWTGHIRAWIGVFSGRQRTIKISYTAGFTPDELDGRTQLGYRRCVDIKYASIVATAAAFLQAKATQLNGLGAQGPITSERIGDAQFTYDAESIRNITGMVDSLPPMAKRLLEPHRRITR